MSDTVTHDEVREIIRQLDESRLAQLATAEGIEEESRSFHEYRKDPDWNHSQGEITGLDAAIRKLKMLIGEEWS